MCRCIQATFNSTSDERFHKSQPGIFGLSIQHVGATISYVYGMNYQTVR